MRQRILVFCTVLATLGLAAFGALQLNDSETSKTFVDKSEDVAINMAIHGPQNKNTFPDFIYDIGPRFAPMKKTKLEQVRSIRDFFDKEEIESMVSLKSVSIIVIKGERQSDIREIGYSDELTKAQLELLQTFDYSSNFLIRADYKQKSKVTGILEDSYATPHLTIVPERQAEYVSGKDALMTYLKENSKEALIDVYADKLRPAKLYFTVTKKGTIENVRLDNHSGYPLVDKTMSELITKAPGVWKPAENAKGEKVDQELVVSFGLRGC